jgi:nitric-oxide synthase
VLSARDHARRLKEIEASIAATGSYRQTRLELEHGAKVAWRNASRCIGRLYWDNLQVRDLRHVRTAQEMFDELVAHLRMASNGGRIRTTISVFAARADGRNGPRIWNPQLIRYAGWRRPDGTVLGDPAHLEFTGMLESLGWRPAERTAFTVLPIVIQVGHERSRIFELPSDAVLEVPITHPDLPWFEELQLRWHALPMLCDMALEAGGLRYPAAPFNGWYMSSEIGARNLSDVDRYNQLPVIARGLGLNTRSSTNLWRDRALVELNVAVLHSFRAAGVRLVDHHSASDQFMTHIEREQKQGRSTPGDWSWLVPPLSGSTTRVFHRYYPDPEAGAGTPQFRYQPAPWRGALDRSRGCPVQHAG